MVRAQATIEGIPRRKRTVAIIERLQIRGRHGAKRGITDGQFWAAVQILVGWEQFTAEVGVQTFAWDRLMRDEGNPRHSPDHAMCTKAALEDAITNRIERADVYLAWSRLVDLDDLGKRSPPNITRSVVTAVVVHDLALDRVGRHLRMGHDRVLKLLRHGLDLYHQAYAEKRERSPEP